MHARFDDKGHRLFLVQLYDIWVPTRVNELEKGGVVDSEQRGDDGEAIGARVSLVVQHPAREVTLVGAARLTEWHPVLAGGWRFPEGEKITTTESVFNLVLDEVHTVALWATESGPLQPNPDAVAVTLGHGFTGKVVEHAYFGSAKCVEDLAPLADENGVARVPETARFARDPETGLVIRLVLA